MNVKAFQFNMFGETTYIVWDQASHEAAIIDPGMINDTEREELDNFISEKSLVVKYLINTHLHIDHVFGDRYVKTRYGVAVSAHPADAPLAERITQQAQMFRLPIDTDNVEIENRLNDGDILRLGNEELKVIHVPGHSPGGIALYAPASGFVISGDSLFAGSIGRTDLPGGDYATLIKSIREKLLTLPPETIVYPGHASSTTIDRELHQNPYL